MNCPDPMLWVDWTEGRLSAVEKARWEDHLSSCSACREETASLVEASPGAETEAPRNPWRRPALAAAAAFLLLAGLWQVARRSPSESPSPEARPGQKASQAGFHAQSASGAFSAPGLLEVLAGPAGEVALAPGSEGRWEGGILHLERGTAWVEASGSLLRIRLRGMDGHLELQEGRVTCFKPGAALEASLFLPSAWAEEASWRIGVLEGEAFHVTGLERRKLEGGGEGLPEDPRRWVLEPAFRLRDAVRPFPVPAGAFAGEILLRKRMAEAGADVLFRAGGLGWRIPLGAHLPSPSEGAWVRLRLERRGDRLRFLAGGREVLSAPPEALGSLLHPVPDAPSFGIRAWGGDVEVREVRWRE